MRRIAALLFAWVAVSAAPASPFGWNKMRRILLFAWVANVSAAPASPFGWNERQPDGTATGRLYLRGHPSDVVYIVDQHEHPVVQNEDGWYVYGTKSENRTSLLRGDERHRQLWYPSDYRVSPESRPPRDLQDEVTSRSIPAASVVMPDVDFLCDGGPQTPWCPDNPPQTGRSADPAITRGVGKIIVLLIRFSDHSDREMPPKEDIEFLFKEEGTDDPRAPTGTMLDFFRLQSLGQYSLDVHVEDWIDAPETEEYYSFGNYGLSNQFAQACYVALDQMDSNGFDWSEFDQDSDGILDTVIIFHSGYVAEGGGNDCNNGLAHGTHRIWSHATTVSDNQDTWYSADRGVRIGRYCATSAIYGTCGSRLQRIGVIGHELLHTLGLPDQLGRPGKGTGVGIYDVMGMMWGPDGSLFYPGLLATWSRSLLRWVSPALITSSGEYTIGTAQLYGDAYKIELAPGEYLLIENRQKLFLDEKMPGDGGLLIWHIDETMTTDWMDRPGYPDASEDWPGNGDHYQLALLSPDGRYDNERGKNYGDKNDCWTNGTSLEPGPGRMVALESEFHLYPNTDSYSGGSVTTTGIRIYDISENGEIMTFRVHLPGTGAVTSLTTPEPTDSPTESPTTSEPTESPTESPTAGPTDSPTPAPTKRPTENPTPRPTSSPTDAPTLLMTPPPTNPPSLSPTASPTMPPSKPPTDPPSVSPTASPTVRTESPTQSPAPSNVPTESPMFAPIMAPASLMGQPIAAPVSTESPSSVPSTLPSSLPSENPSKSPSEAPAPAPTLGHYAYDNSPTPRGGVVLRRPFDYGQGQ